MPKQEAGRISDSELSLSRANRSVRLWQHVIDRLSTGEQPERDQLEAVGYLVRTTAVYGSGKFGAADRLTICDRDSLLMVEAPHVCCCQEGLTNPEQLASTRAYAIDEDIVRQINALAFQTYVPATEQSRAGAGAGLTDND